MLEFFRKYQKIFFVFVTAIIVVSFTFFGASSAFQSKQEVPNKQVATAVDGSKIMEREFFTLTSMLSERMPLSGDYMRQKWLLSERGVNLALVHFDVLKNDLQRSYERVRRFAPYVHPKVESISAEMLWSQLAPAINDNLDILRNGPDQIGEKEVKALFALYNAQTRFPEHYLRQMLFYQMQKVPDQTLAQRDLSIAGLQTAEDWFGTAFVKEVAKLVWNTAIKAEQEGIQIAKKESGTALLRNTFQMMRDYAREEVPTAQEAQSMLMGQLRSLGVDEREARELWEKVLVTEKLFALAEEKALDDSAAFASEKEKASHLVEIKEVAIKPQLQLRTFQDLLKFERYLDAVSERETPLAIPENRKEVSQIEELFPELIDQKVVIELKKVAETTLLSRISLRETFDWQKNETNFAEMARYFSLWAGQNFTSDDERFAALEKLDPLQRAKLDRFAKEKIVKAHPQWKKEAFAKAQTEIQTCSLSPGAKLPFDREAFFQHLESENSDEIIELGDGYLYSMNLKERGAKTLLSYEEALERGALDQILERTLTTCKESFPDKNDQELGALLYTDLLSAIDQGVPFEKLERYASARYDQLLETVAKAGDVHWAVETQTLSIQADHSRFDEASRLEEGQWSSPFEGALFQVVGKKTVEPNAELLAKVEVPLRKAAEAKFLSELLGSE